MIGESGSNLGYYIGGGGVLLAIGQMAWQRFFTKEGKANDVLVGQLSERLASQETRLIILENGLDEERKLRRQSENEVHALKLENAQQRAELIRQITALEMDNLALRAELSRHNINVPAAIVATRVNLTPAT